MAWPYHLVDLTDQQKHHRRELLDRYGIYSQLSALIPVLGYQLYRLGGWVYSERRRAKVDYSAVPTSPAAKKERHTTSGIVVRKWRGVVWWLEGEVAPSWGLGLRGQWIATGSWMVWLLFLCVHRTGDGMYSFLNFYHVVVCITLHWQGPVSRDALLFLS